MVECMLAASNFDSRMVFEMNRNMWVVKLLEVQEVDMFVVEELQPYFLVRSLGMLAHLGLRLNQLTCIFRF